VAQSRVPACDARETHQRAIGNNPGMLHRMHARAPGVALSLLLVLAAPASAMSERCDDGSPPPDDFGVRQTGTPSVTSSHNWLYSAGGAEAYERWSRWGAGLTLLQRLTGGIVRGMMHALSGRRGSLSCVGR
jgi:heme A synthase